MLRFAARGWKIFPCRSRAKEPAIRNWPNRATSDSVQLVKWAQKFSSCNWAVATGDTSGIFALDFDGDHAVQSLLNQCEFPGQLDSLTVKTARGWHLYFAWPEGAEIRNSASKIAPGIDVRGEGGYCLIPPSVHPSGVA